MENGGSERGFVVLVQFSPQFVLISVVTHNNCGVPFAFRFLTISSRRFVILTVESAVKELTHCKKTQILNARTENRPVDFSHRELLLLITLFLMTN